MPDFAALAEEIRTTFHLESSRLTRALARIPFRESIAVRLYYIYGLTLKETGRRFGICAERCRQVIFSGRRSLRRKLMYESSNSYSVIHVQQKQAWFRRDNHA